MDRIGGESTGEGMVRRAALIALVLALSGAPTAQAASFVCNVKTQSFCYNGKSCKKQPYDDSDYFIADIDNQTFNECRIEDCRSRLVLFWKTDDNTVIISHRDMPRTTRLSIFPNAEPDSDLNSFTQSTLSSVMTVVQSGTCFRQLVIPPPIAKPSSKD